MKDRKSKKTDAFLFGMRKRRGLFGRFALYAIASVLAFTYLYPLLSVLSTSMMTPDDMVNSRIGWIPSSFYVKNYLDAVLTLDYKATFLKTLILTVLPTLLQTFTCSLAGYAFARFSFPFKRLLMGLLVLSYLIPFQATMIPTYVLYNSWNLTGHVSAFLLPAALGQGLRSALFVLIFFSFYRQIPQTLIEAAYLDGAGPFVTYCRVAVPLSKAGFLVSFVFSVVWYWNETTLVNLFLGLNNSRENGLTTLMLELERFTNTYQKMFDRSGALLDPLNDGIQRAGTILCLLPLLILYAVLQRHFIESLDSSGITGE